MASFNGLKTIAATDIQNSGRFYLGNQLDTGTAGQALVSSGPNEPARCDPHSGTIQPLTIGNNLSLASGNSSFNGGTADTLNATNTTYQGSSTINIDTTTNPDTINCIKVPGTLTINQNTTLLDTFDGSTNKTINLEGKYSAGDGIEISGHTIPVIEADTDENTISKNVGGAEQLQVLKVPNALTAGTNISFSSGTTYDGSSAITINASDSNTQLNLTEGNGITITNTGGLNRTIAMSADGSTLSDNVGSGQAGVLKVPNALTAGTNISFSSGTTYDGSSAITINASDTDTTYQGGTGISIDTTTNPDTINCANIPNSALANSTISGKALGTNLANITFFQADGTFITSYNGADPPTSVVLDGDTTYQGGTNITIDTTTNPDTINLNGSLTNVNLSSSTNTFPLFVGGSEILKSMSYIDNVTQNFNQIFNTVNKYFFDGSQTSGSDTLEIDFTATSSSGYCEYGFYANTLTSGMIFCVGIAAATGGTSPFSTTLTSSPVSIDAYKIGLFDGTTTTYSLKEILDFTSFENTYITSKFFFNNLSVGTRYRMALYGRCHNAGSIIINAGGKNTTGFTNRSFHQPAFMKFYEYDSSIGGARTTSSGGGGDDY